MLDRKQTRKKKFFYQAKSSLKRLSSKLFCLSQAVERGKKTHSNKADSY